MHLTSSNELQKYFSRVKSRGKKVLIITEENVFLIYNKLLKQLDLPVLVIPSGEKMKSRKGKEFIEDYLFQSNYFRNTELIAFGGGVVLDLVGFVAATYMRGITFSMIPTTIIAWVDASIGGKTGINTDYGKNLIGNFYFPVDVCREEIFLETLPKSLYQEQFSEIVKIALILDRDFFFSMENPFNRAVDLKIKVVELDERDDGIRQILNYGHTFAHALELVSDYKVSHGKAVWMGLFFESLLSFNLGILEDSDWEILKIKLKNEFSKSIFDSVDIEKLYNAMLLDKKNKNKKAHFILLEKIGLVYKKDKRVAHPVPKSVVLTALRELKSGALCVVE